MNELLTYIDICYVICKRKRNIRIVFNEGLAMQIKRKRQNNSAHFGVVTTLRHGKKKTKHTISLYDLTWQAEGTVQRLILITAHTFAGTAFGHMMRRLRFHAEVWVWTRECMRTGCGARRSESRERKWQGVWPGIHSDYTHRFRTLHVSLGKSVPLQARGAQVVPKWYGSQILWQWPRMVVRLSALLTGRFYPQEILLVLISVRGCVYPRAIVRSEGLWQWKIPLTPAGKEPATFKFIAQHLDHFATAVPTH